MLCVWWHQKGVVCCEPLKSGETINAARYRQQVTNSNRALITKC